jgi:hypothetical protein
MHRRFWCGNLKERDHLEYLGLDVRRTLKFVLKKQTGVGWGGFICHRIG